MGLWLGCCFRILTGLADALILINSSSMQAVLIRPSPRPPVGIHRETLPRLPKRSDQCQCHEETLRTWFRGTRRLC